MSDNLPKKALMTRLGLILLGYILFFIGRTGVDIFQGRVLVWPYLLSRPFAPAISYVFILMGWGLYQRQKQNQPQIWSKERFVRYLLPLIGIGLVLFLEVSFSALLKEMGPHFLQHSTDFGFKEPTLFYIVVLNPFTIPVCTVFLSGLFFGAVIQEKDLWRAVLLALAFTLVVAFAIFWTVVICWLLLLFNTTQRAPIGIGA